MYERTTAEFKKEAFIEDIFATVGEGSLRKAELKAGVSASTLSRINAGALPDMATFLQICGALKLDPTKYFVLIVWKGEATK